MKAGPSAGTSVEFALQVGSATNSSWCQGGLWSWVNPGSTRTVSRPFSQIKCPAGVTLDLTQVRAVRVFLNGGGDVYLDNLRVQ